MVAQARPPIPPLPTVKYVEDGPSIKVGKEEAPRSQESTHSEILAAAFSTAVALDFSVTADGAGGVGPGILQTCISAASIWRL